MLLSVYGVLGLDHGVFKTLPLQIISSYQNLLTSKPLLTNMITASVLAVASDSVSQKIERITPKQQINLVQKNENKSPSNGVQQIQLNHSYYRSSTMAIYGALVFGAFVTYWMKILNGWFPLHGMTLQRLLVKIFVNQLFMSPFLNALFFSWVVFTRDFKSSLVEKLDTLNKKVVNDLVATIKRSCIYWTIVHLFNFSIIPYQYQLLCINLEFFLWTMYLSWVGYRKIQ